MSLRGKRRERSWESVEAMIATIKADLFSPPRWGCYVIKLQCWVRRLHSNWCRISGVMFLLHTWFYYTPLSGLRALSVSKRTYTGSAFAFIHHEAHVDGTPSERLACFFFFTVTLRHKDVFECIDHFVVLSVFLSFGNVTFCHATNN